MSPSPLSPPTNRRQVSDLRSRDRGFDPWSGCYQVVTTKTTDCPETGKLPRYITNAKVNSAFHPSWVGESVSTCLAGVMMGHIHFCRVAANTVWSHMAGDAPQLSDGFPIKNYRPPLPFLYLLILILYYTFQQLAEISPQFLHLQQLQTIMCFNQLTHIIAAKIPWHT